MEYWDDDWDYDLDLWIASAKNIDQIASSIGSIFEPISVVDHEFMIGAVECEILNVTDSPPEFEGIPAEDYSVIVRIPISTDLPWCFVSKPVAVGLAISLKYAFRSNILMVADDDFYVASLGTGIPLKVNSRYKPWNFELSGFLDQNKYEKVVL